MSQLNLKTYNMKIFKNEFNLIFGVLFYLFVVSNLCAKFLSFITLKFLLISFVEYDRNLH